MRGADGQIVVAALTDSVIPLSYAGKSTLLTSWTGRTWEPKGTGGVDDNNHSYTDPNYWNFCAPGAATVALYYFISSKPFVTSIAPANYTEPRNDGYLATTYWKASDTVSNGRGALMYMAEYEKPPVSYSWPLRGIVNWSNAYPTGTPVNRLRDGMNWEASGRSTLNYFYVQVPATSLTQSTLLSHVQTDVAGVGVPVIANVKTGNGSVNLPGWLKTGGVNHSIAIVGYDDTVSPATYTFIDTCGPGCNNTNSPAGVRTVSQSTLWTLLMAETDNDGIVW